MVFLAEVASFLANVIALAHTSIADLSAPGGFELVDLMHCFRLKFLFMHRAYETKVGLEVAFPSCQVKNSFPQRSLSGLLDHAKITQ